MVSASPPTNHIPDAGKMVEPPKVRRFKRDFTDRLMLYDGERLYTEYHKEHGYTFSDLLDNIKEGHDYEIDADGNRIESPEVKPAKGTGPVCTCDISALECQAHNMKVRG